LSLFDKTKATISSDLKLFLREKYKLTILVYIVQITPVKNTDTHKDKPVTEEN
jgi:hypothetical protein